MVSLFGRPPLASMVKRWLTFFAPLATYAMRPFRPENDALAPGVMRNADASTTTKHAATIIRIALRSLDRRKLGETC